MSRTRARPAIAWGGSAALVAVAVLLLVDLLEAPSPPVHVAIELTAACIAAAGFAWVWIAYVRDALADR